MGYTRKAWTLAVAAGVLMMSTASPAFAADCKVGISIKQLNAPYFAELMESAKKAAKAKGCKVLTADAQGKVMKQIADIEDMLSRDIDLLIMDPAGPDGLVQVTREAAQNGVKTVVLDSSINEAAKYVTVVQSNNKKNGELVGQWIVDKMGGKPLRIALISGAKGNPVGRVRRESVLSGIAKAQKQKYGEKNYTIVGHGWGNWTQQGGLNAMEDILTASKNINLLVSENDSMALGARRAIKAQGLTDQITIAAAADGQKQALKLIKEGKYGVTGLNAPDLIANTGVDIGIKAINGKLPEDFPKITYTPPVAITKSNVDKYYNPNSAF
ncbi:substrate-binding domain-containing protein [Salinisphaera sp.]|uniref:substrate-binding domain-containing protein n=1 Tax=Salinisphaera sp. TaxID=1914330 RepID=UPI002D790EAC|nr:substrate-binding domain-containing protein [Salinisphaera sp.]HET7314414.1 substrate-binding domain-containing protein [Salinisphaera sp.]